ncbi:Dihydrofolate reductase [Hathewaya proteolytica DSM 3090]|uniref:Dihydrofolate reductase n=1 Tax=Hathewaya proteolytica DSM 3090 TaxID=1121331 RepID=A0A1M6NYX2_9CLOT|nr:dihydrofolate reductase family protein [Hathewaya proteolytica]SHK00844.1 Dihydrofolate reductase [Hathewaya proteolytica DSM 3090]
MNRKVILYIACSVDGFIADECGKINWLGGDSNLYDGDYGHKEFLDTIDTVVMGYKTYEQVINEISPEVWPYENQITYVFTHRKKLSHKGVNFIEEDLNTFIEDEKMKKGKNIWICGGASFANSLIKDNLIDEYHIVTMPIILGKGMRLFYDDNPKKRLRLKNCREINGTIESVYTPHK